MLRQPARSGKFVARLFFVLTALGVLAFLLWPASVGRGLPTRTACKNHLKMIALAMQNYHDTYHRYPPAYVADGTGRPMHSWRVLLLPFMEYQLIYDQYRFDEPWDGPHNRRLQREIPSLYQCPARRDRSNDSTETDYLVVIGPNTVYAGARTIASAEITDNNADTILVVETRRSGIDWMEPRDMPFEQATRGVNAKESLCISSLHPGGAQVALADGSVRFLNDETTPGLLKGLLERNDGKLPADPAFVR